MARDMSDDYQDTYRARIIWKYRKVRDGWKWGDPRSDQYVDDPDAKEWVTCYGPYATKGVAKGMISHHRRNYAIGSIEIVSHKVQKASITWEDVSD